MDASSSGPMFAWTRQTLSRHRRIPKCQHQRRESPEHPPPAPWLLLPGRDACREVFLSCFAALIAVLLKFYVFHWLLSAYGPTVLLSIIKSKIRAAVLFGTSGLIFVLLVHAIARRSAYKSCHKHVVIPATKPAVNKINVLVRGLAHKGVLLVIKPEHSVGDALSALRRRHLLPSSTRVRYSVFSSASGLRPLRACDILQDVGIQDLSTLHIRARIIGGVRGTPDPYRATAFTERTGMFASQHANHFRPDGNGKFVCLPCSQYEPIHLLSRHIMEHEQSKNHKRALDRYQPILDAGEESGVAQVPSGSVSMLHRVVRSEHHDVDPTEVREGLVGLLEWVGRSGGAPGSSRFFSPSRPPSPPMDGDHETAQTDWDALGMDGFHLQPSYEEAAMSTMATRLLAYRKTGR